MMRYCVLCAALALAAFLPKQTLADRPADRAGEMFQARCANCHFIPDPSVRTDRAWLDQVNRTS